MKRIIRLATFTAMLSVPMPALADSIHALMYKDPVCSCCETYAVYLEKNGFQVEIKPSTDLTQIGQKAGVPDQLLGCHTIFVDGYVVEGLVPVEAVQKMLKERPAIAGIAMPGMPNGSPGMGGEKTGPFTVYAFTKDGAAPTVYVVQ